MAGNSREAVLKMTSVLQSCANACTCEDGWKAQPNQMMPFRTIVPTCSRKVSEGETFEHETCHTIEPIALAGSVAMCLSLLSKR